MALTYTKKLSSFLLNNSEILGFLFLISYQIYLLRPFLINANTTLTHDGFYLVLPVFHYLAKNLQAGIFPYWNSLSHGGEAFYPLIPYFKLMDAFTLCFIYFGKYLTQNIFLLFNWYHYLSFLLMNAGIYACLRVHCNHALFRFSLIAILLYSSSFLAPFRQPGYLAQFQWTPWIVFFLLKILREKKQSWPHFLMLGVLSGMTWQAYWFSGTWLFVALFGLGALLWNKRDIKEVFQTPKIKPKFFLSLFIWLSMLLPNLVLYSEQNRWISPVRLLPANFHLLESQGASMLYELNPASAKNPSIVSFENIKFSGTLSKITDFFQLLYPNGNKKAHPKSTVWGNTSEILLYIGVLPFLIALIGIFWGRENFKYPWLMVLLGSGLLMLGPTGGIHFLLYWVFPPLWFIRHTALFAPVFIFALLYFYCLGFKILVGFKETPLQLSQFSLTVKSSLSSIGFAVLLVFLGLLSIHTPIIRDKMVFLPILSIIFFTHFLMQRIVKIALFLPVVLSQFLVVFFSCPNQMDYLKYILCIGILPLLALLFLTHSKNKQLIRENLFFTLSSGLLTIAILYDLNFYFIGSQYLYRGQEIPSSYLADSRTFDLTTLKRRIVHSPFPKIPASTLGPLREQSPRYLELIHGTPTAFSNPYGQESKHEFSFDFVSNHRRWSPILLQKYYSELVFSKIATNLSKEFFAINQDAFQFKSSVFPLSLGSLPNFLIEDTPSNLNLLQHSIYLSEGVWTPNFLPELKSDFHLKIQKFSPNEVHLDIDSSRRGYLYWADGFDEHWKAFNGYDPLPIYRANLNFKALPITAGKSPLKLYYDPRYFRLALGTYLLMTLFGLSTAVLLTLFAKLRSLKLHPHWSPSHA